jgi:hypothetical protein
LNFEFHSDRDQAAPDRIQHTLTVKTPNSYPWYRN